MVIICNMPFFRKTSHVGAVILGAAVGSAGALFGGSSLLSSASAVSGNGTENDAGVSAQGIGAIPVVSRKDVELKFVQIFFRHGARTPLGAIPSIEEGFWDKDTLFEGPANTCIDYKVCALDGGPQPVWKTELHYRKKPLKGGSFKGQLTAKGMLQAHDLGIRLRKHYIDQLAFLPEEFGTDVVYPRSTNIHRTLQSLGCLLGGLYGSTLTPKQTVPVTFFVDEPATEILYPNSGRCKQLSSHYSSVFQDMFKVPGMRHASNQIAPLLDVAEEKTEKMDFIRIRDDLTARIEHNVDVPKFLLPVIDVIEKYAVVLTKFLIEGGDSSKKEVIRFSAGPTMHYVTETLDAASKKEIPYKLHLNSCHDTTLMTILLALEAYDDIWPPLTASVIFELYQDKAGNSFVRTLYENKELRICQSQDTLVPLEKFKQLIAPVCYTSQDYTDACRVEGS